MDPTGGGGTSTDIVPTYLVWICARVAEISLKNRQNAKKFPLTPIVTKISFAPFSARRGPPIPKRGEVTQATPACELWRESAGGLLRNRWPNKKNKQTKTYSKTNTSLFALTSEWRVKKRGLYTSNFVIFAVSGYQLRWPRMIFNGRYAPVDFNSLSSQYVVALAVKCQRFNAMPRNQPSGPYKVKSTPCKVNLFTVVWLTKTHPTSVS